MELKELLLKHYELYPKMQITDIVKLIYQNEFAGGHMIKNETVSLRRLEEEYHVIMQQNPDKQNSGEVFESIGNHLCRLHLRALNNYDISLQTINKFFVNTANSVKGSMERFEEKLEILKKCVQEGLFPFSLADLEAYLVSYKKQGYPPVSHSEAYRSSYAPAYRIVSTAYQDYFAVFCKIDVLLKTKDQVMIAIAGDSNNKKSKLSSLIRSVYGPNVSFQPTSALYNDLKIILHKENNEQLFQIL